jgi:Mannosyl-glycoprotein endo-beta-N-acetylglucosaminidase
MKRFLPSGLMIFAGVLGIAATTQADQDVTKIRKKFDLREVILRRFFKENRAPVEPYAGVFVREADTYHLDWRLLPSLSMIESGGGKYARNNNLFGWANGKWAFDSISEAVHHVAYTLSNGKAYRGKTLEAKLWTYNHRSEYKTTVMGIMNKIYPGQNVQTSD